MNKKMTLILILVALAVFISTSCTTKKSNIAMNEGIIEKYQWDVAESINTDGRNLDAIITSAIKQKFAADELVSSSKINVDTANGSVTLNGKVSSQLKVDRAIELGRTVEGVRRVRSNLILQ